MGLLMETPHTSLPDLPLDDDGPVSVSTPPQNPEILARVDACLAALTPEMRATLEEAERLDRLDYERHR